MLSGGRIRPCACMEETERKRAQVTANAVDNFRKLLLAINSFSPLLILSLAPRRLCLHKATADSGDLKRSLTLALEEAAYHLRQK
jgi:hypothetical protein